MISAIASRSVYDTSTEGTDPVLGAAEPSAPRELPTNPSAMGRDEFLKLLVAQLKNQDPLNPMDGKDMAAQLAQFSTVEQLISINNALGETKDASKATALAIGELQQTQNERADELAQMMEGQMAMATVGKIGVTAGNTVFVDKDGGGTVVIDSGTVTGAGKITVKDDKGNTVSSAYVDKVNAGQQGFELKDFEFDPPLKGGKYAFKFEVATEGSQKWQEVKTYTAGRITGMKYENGFPILVIGDSLSVPMSQLTQVRG